MLGFAVHVLMYSLHTRGNRTSLDLNEFLLAFSRFTNLRGAVDTVYSDNGSTFRAAADRLSSSLGSTEFCNSLRRRNINWVKIPPYSSSQGGSWESMVKLFKDAFNCVLDQSRRKPSLIEMQTFTSDAMHIVNDRPLTSLSDKPNDLAVITPSSFLGQGLAPNTPLSAFHDWGTCVETSFTIQLWLINFGSVGCKVTSLLYKAKTNGG